MVLFVKIFLTLFVLFPLGILFKQAQRDLFSSFTLEAFRALGFSLLLASLSSLLCLLLAWPLSQAGLNSPRWIQKLIDRWGFLPFVLSPFFWTLSLIDNFGRRSPLVHLISFFTEDYPRLLYHPFSLLLAHVFYNLPFVLRLVMQARQGIPQYFLDTHCELKGNSFFQKTLFEWTLLKRFIGQALFIVFLFCFSSLPLVLFFRGASPYQTLEVSVYHALRLPGKESFSAFWSLVPLLIHIPLLYLLQRQRIDPWKKNPRISHVSKLASLVSLSYLFLYVFPFAYTMRWLFPPEGFLTILQRALPAFWQSTLLAFFVSFISLYLARFIYQVEANNTQRGSSFLKNKQWLLFVPWTLSPLSLSWAWSLGLKNLPPFWTFFMSLSFLTWPLQYYFLSSAYQQLEAYWRLSQELERSSWKNFWFIERKLAGHHLWTLFSFGFLGSLQNMSIQLIPLSSQIQVLPLHIFRYWTQHQIHEALFLSSLLFVLSFLFLFTFKEGQYE